MLQSLKQIYVARFNNKRERQNVWHILVKDYFQRFISKNDTVLDVGCGYGDFINYVVAKKKLAVDLNAAGRGEIAKNVRFFVAPSSKMPFIRAGSIDKIFVSNFFEHLRPEEIEATIKEFRRVLKSGGQVLILQPNIRLLLHDFWMFFDHLTPIDDRALVEIFGVHNFNLKKRIVRFIPYTRQSRLPKWPFFIKLYLRLPFIWRIFGKQSFLIFKKL